MLGKNLLSSVLTQIPVFIFGVMAGIFSTRFLGDDTKGVFSLFQANTQLFVLLFSLGIQTGIVYFISAKKIPEEIVVGMSASILLAGTFLLFLILLVLKALNLFSYLVSVDFNYWIYVFIIIALFSLSISNAVLSAFFQAHSRFKIINIISILNGLFNSILFTILFFSYKNETLSDSQKINYALFTTLVSLIINSIIWLYYYKKEINQRLNISFKFSSYFKDFILYSLLIYLGTIINFFNYRIDLWIVNYFLDTKSLSYYSLAGNIAQIILYISVAIGSVILPYLSGKNENERILIFSKICRYSFSFFLLIVLVAYLLSDFIIPIVYGKNFNASILPFKILLPGILLSCFTQLLATLIVACKKNILNIIATSIGLCFTIILDFLLIPVYGIEGAAWATSISYCIICLSTFLLILKKLGYPMKNYFIVSRNDIKHIIGYIKK